MSFPALRRFLPALLLTLAVAAAFYPSLRGEFIWDDNLHVTENPTIVGPLGLKEIWSTSSANYFPLVLTNFWLQHALFGLNPLPYHVVTIIWHAGAALLLWRVLLQLRVPGAWFGAALWALHPIQAESVAWISELKNTQSAVFFLLAIRFYLKWIGVAPGAVARGEGGVRRGYVLTLVCFVAAILSKPSTVMLPPVLGLLAWWQRGRLTRRDVLALLPFFALSALAAGWTVWEQQHHSGAIGPEWEQTRAQRVMIAGSVVWFYLGKLLWPEPLIFIYPRWEPEKLAPLGWIAVVAVAGLLAFLWWRRSTRWRPVFVAAVFFGALLFPVMGFFRVYFFRYSFVGDHFQYLASMAPLALLGAGVWTLTLLIKTRQSLVQGAVAGGILFSLGVVSWRECEKYRSSEHLWRTTIAQNPTCVMAWLNLADWLAQRNRLPEAEAAYREALRLRPTNSEGHTDLGSLLVLTQRAEESLRYFQRSLQLRPDRPEVYNNLGNALRNLGRSDEAQASYRRAIELKPDYIDAYNNLGAELAEAGRPAEAVAQFEAALRLDPQRAQTYQNLGGALRALGRHAEAVERLEAALRLQPDSPIAAHSLGLTLLAQGKVREGLAQLERSLALKPNQPAVRGSLGRALIAQGRTDEGLRQLREAVRLAPESGDAHSNLGVALMGLDQKPAALEHFAAAVRVAPKQVASRVNYGMALAGQQRWAEAAEQFGQAAEQQPQSAELAVQTAVALVNANRLEAAVPQFEKALRLQPGRAEVHQQFAQLLSALGRRAEALQQLEAAADAARRGPGRQP